VQEKIMAIIIDAISDLNEELQYDTLNTINRETPIFNGEYAIDSLSLVRLVTTLESRVANEFDQKITLADEKVMSQRNSPFKTAGTIADFIAEKLNLELA
jgi:acyl carrier protein